MMSKYKISIIFIIFINLFLNAFINIEHANTKYLITSVDNLRVREEPSMNGKVLCLLKKNQILEKISEYGEGEDVKMNIEGHEYSGMWYKVKVNNGIQGYVYTGYVKYCYVFDNYYIYYNNSRIIFCLKYNNYIIKTISTEKDAVDIYCYNINNFLFIQPYRQFYPEYDEFDFEINECTNLLMIDSKFFKLINDFEGHFLFLLLSPSNNFMTLVRGSPGRGYPPLTYRTILYSIKDNNILYDGGLLLEGEWLENDDYVTYIVVGPKVKDQECDENHTFIQKIIINKEKIIETDEYEQIWVP